MKKPQIVCLCGSTRFPDTFARENRRLTLSGCIVLSVGVFVHSDHPDLGDITEAQKQALDLLHLHKIDLADRVHILNVQGRIGESTKHELACAIARRKEVTFLDPAAGEEYMQEHSHELGRLVATIVKRGHVAMKWINKSIEITPARDGWIVKQQQQRELEEHPMLEGSGGTDYRTVHHIFMTMHALIVWLEDTKLQWEA